MNSIARIIALAMFVALALSATTGTFSAVTSFASATTSAVAYTNGYVVTLSAAGWAYGDSISLSGISTTSTTWTTVTAFSGLTGVGLALVSSSACTSAPTVTSTGYTTSTLVGDASATGVNCFADFATLYTAAATGTTTGSPFAYSSPTLALALSSPVQWIITTPSVTPVSTQCDSISVKVGSNSAIASTSGACSGSGVLSQAVSTGSFAFYVQTATSATVCFQTDAQHTASTSCGSVVTSSAGILSATISGFVAMIALIFFN